MLSAVKTWARRQRGEHPGLRQLGLFGSFARGESGVGSDLDLVAVIEDSELPFERRAAAWDLLGLPVPADLLVYTTAEWRSLLDSGGRFARVLHDETVWLVKPA